MADEFSSASPTPETPPPRTTGGNWRWEPPTAAELQTLMPGYTIEKLLGRGGMGAVYRGVQTNLDRTVAIKILPPGVEKEDPSFAERFKNEARLMAKLNHPAVVAVHDFGTTLGGQLYFAMEYVDGSDVSQMISAQGRLPPDHALAITAHVCDALSAAHELGIVHRDIKPANVLLNKKGQVKVADFGLAKMEDPGQHGLTKTGYAMGTPDFVAPEALMLGTAVDGRADLYAVGVMLYQMLTGNIPRGAFKPAFVLVPGLDPRYDPIISKAMQYDREERHQSAEELRRELDVILTVPLVKQDAPTAAALPATQVLQVPAQRSAMQKSSVKEPPKSNMRVVLGFGAAAVIAIGIFVFSGRGRQTVDTDAPEPQPLTSPTALPPKKTEPPKPMPQTPKPVVAAAPMPASATPVFPLSVVAPEIPPELATLKEQFLKLQAERVATPYETGLAKLNTSYLGGIDKAILAEKNVGHLDGVLVLEEEKALVTARQPVPDGDDEKTTAALKSLRAIYRAEKTKLGATYVINLKALTDPLEARLKQMEADFTKADRLADAKTVRSYRETLAESNRVGSTETTAAAMSPGHGSSAAGLPAEAAVEVAAKIAAKGEVSGLAAGALVFDGPTGNGRIGAKGVLLRNEQMTGKNGTTWAFNYTRAGTARGMQIIHPYGRGQAIIHVLMEGVGISTPEFWTEVGYGGGDLQRIKKGKGFDEIFPLKENETYEVVSKLDGQGGYELVFNHQVVITARVTTTSPLSLEIKPEQTFPVSGRGGGLEFKGDDLPLQWEAGYAALLLYPLDRGVNLCQDVRFWTATAR